MGQAKQALQGYELAASSKKRALVTWVTGQDGSYLDESKQRFHVSEVAAPKAWIFLHASKPFNSQTA
jgi:hypothetical protein